MKLAGTIRPPFLILGPVCVLPGIATARAAGAPLVWWEVLLVVLGAVCAHIAVNVFNEYQDFKSGLDAKTIRTPFSGGSGTLQAHPSLEKPALLLGIATTAVTAGIGLYFVFVGQLLLLAIGGAGIVTIALYTPWIVRSPIVCLLAPGLGFGTFMVLGAHVALGAPITWGAVVASLVPFFLVNNLLLLNQFPDIEQDKSVGRKNILIAHGRKTGIAVYGLFVALCYAAIGAGAAASILPVWSLLGLLTVPGAVAAVVGASRHHSDIEKLIPALGLNVLVVNLTPVLMAVGILIG